METARGVTQCFSIVSRCQRRFLAENGEHVAAVFAVAFLQRWRRDVVCSQRGCYVVNYGLFLSDPTARRRYTPRAARVSRQADGRRGLPTFASPQGLTRSRCPAVIKQGCRSLVQLKKALSVAHLPALPQSAIRLLELSKNPTTGPAEFAIPIEFDPGLAGQVLRFVNSSYFGFAREISSVKMAIALVGMRTIKNFALWNAVFSLMPNPKCGPFDLKALWQDSLRRALFARAFGKMLHLDEDDDPFAAALLQDMAVPLLAKEAPEVYRQLLLDRGFQNARLSTLEEQKFGWSHAAAGGIIARQWNLPEQFAVLIENHVAVDVWIEQRQREPAKLAVALSALLPSTSDSFWIERGEFETCYGRAAPPASPSVPAMLAQIDSEFEKFAPVLKVSTPAKSLLDWYQEASVGVA